MKDDPHATPIIPFSRPYTVGTELQFLRQALDASHLSGDGKFSVRCHAWLERHTGAKKALLTHSCTAALEMAALLCDIQLGDEVIMPSFTFVSTANAFVLRGATPVFVDVRSDTLNIDESLIEQAITPRTKAIVPVHYAGVSCDMVAIMQIAAKHRLFVIEDAAQALLGTSACGKPLGSIGHLGCLSFHETKNIISGEGGALLVNDEQLIERSEVIREKGTNRSKFFRGEVDKYTWVDIGSSYLPSELIAAFLWAQFESAVEITRGRKQLVGMYQDLLSPLAAEGKFQLPECDIGMSGNGHLMYLLARSLDERTRLIAFLREHGVNTVFHYVPLHSSPAGRRYGRTATDMRVTNQIADRLVRLPIFSAMTEAELLKVVQTIAAFYEGGH